MQRKRFISSVILIVTLSGCQGNPVSAPVDSKNQVEVKPLAELVGSKNAVSFSQSNFQVAERPTSGTVELAQSDQTYHLVFGADFQSSKGPDLQVILHQSKNLLPELSPPTFPLQNSDYIVLGPLKSLKGQQVYPIPPAVNIAEYGSVAIWCEKFNATFGAANLKTSAP